MRVYISPSDQSGNIYSFGGTNEAKVCREIGLKLYNELTSRGVTTKLASAGLSYQERARDSNNWGATIHLPIHTNAGGGDGTVVFCSPGNVNNKYVKSIYESVASISPGKDDGIRPVNNLYEINNTKAVCVYVECEFHDNATLAKWIVEHTGDIAIAIADGLVKNAVSPVNPPSKDDSFIYVQAGAFYKIANAVNMVTALRRKGFDSFYWYDSDTELYKIQAGVFSNEENADRLVKQLKINGFEAIKYRR